MLMLIMEILCTAGSAVRSLLDLCSTSEEDYSSATYIRSSSLAMQLRSSRWHGWAVPAS